MEAYKKLRDACFPETLNPDVQGNPEAIQAYAVEFVNLKLFPVLKKSERLDRCTREPSSMSSWFRHIEDIQMGDSHGQRMIIQPDTRYMWACMLLSG